MRNGRLKEIRGKREEIALNWEASNLIPNWPKPNLPYTKTKHLFLSSLLLSLNQTLTISLPLFPMMLWFSPLSRSNSTRSVPLSFNFYLLLSFSLFVLLCFCFHICSRFLLFNWSDFIVSCIFVYVSVADRISLWCWLFASFFKFCLFVEHWFPEIANWSYQLYLLRFFWN